MRLRRSAGLGRVGYYCRARVKVLEASIPILRPGRGLRQPIRNIASTDAGAVIAAYYAAVRPRRVTACAESAPLWPDF